MIRITRSIVLLINLLVLIGCSGYTPDPAGSQRYYGDGSVLDYQLRLGKDLFEHNCAVCHGDDGSGSGFNSYNLDPSPRDLTDPSFQTSLSDERLAEVIRYGGKLRGRSQNMPRWGGKLNDNQINLLVKYVRTFNDSSSVNNDR